MYAKRKACSSLRSGRPVLGVWLLHTRARWRHRLVALDRDIHAERARAARAEVLAQHDRLVLVAAAHIQAQLREAVGDLVLLGDRSVAPVAARRAQILAAEAAGPMVAVRAERGERRRVRRDAALGLVPDARLADTGAPLIGGIGVHAAVLVQDDSVDLGSRVGADEAVDHVPPDLLGVA